MKGFGSMEPARARLATALLLAAAMAAAALSGLLHGVRLDMTGGKANTLSAAFARLVSGLPASVEATYYRSPRLMERHPGPGAIAALLHSMESLPGSRLKVRVVDPAASGRDPGALGLEPRDITTRSGDERSVATVWSGIVLRGPAGVAAIPFILDESGLETVMTRAIRKAAFGLAPSLAVLVGDTDRTIDSDYRILRSSLENGLWEITELRQGDPVPAGTAVLLVLGNSSLDASDAANMHGYIASGGKAFLALKGVDIKAGETLTAHPLEDRSVPDVLSGYGITLGDSLVLDPWCLTVPYDGSAGSAGGADEADGEGSGGGTDGADTYGSIRYIRYPYWVAVRPEAIAASHPATAGLSALDLFWPSPLGLSPAEGVRTEVLVRSGPGAIAMPSPWLMDPVLADKAMTEAGRSGEPSGPAALAVAAELDKAKGGGRLVVVSSSDFASDLMGMTESTFNTVLVTSSLDWLDLGNEASLDGVRRVSAGRLDRIGEPALRNRAIAFNYSLNLVVIPLVLVGGPLWKAWKSGRPGKRRERPGTAA